MKLTFKNFLYLQVVFIGILLFAFLGVVNAQETTNEIETAAQQVKTSGLVTCHPTYEANGTLDNDCNYNALIRMVNRAIKYFIYLSTFIAVGMFTYAGFMYFAAASSGSPGKKESAKKIFSSVLIGLFFVYTAWLIVYTIMNSLLSDEAKTGPDADIVNPLKPAQTTLNILNDKNV